MINRLIKKVIKKANKANIDAYMDMIFVRKKELYDDWDIYYFALPKNDCEYRAEIIHNIYRLNICKEDVGLRALINSVVITALREADKSKAQVYAIEATERMLEVCPEVNMEEFIKQFDPAVKAGRDIWIREFLAQNRAEGDWDKIREELMAEE